MSSLELKAEFSDLRDMLQRLLSHQTTPSHPSSSQTSTTNHPLMFDGTMLNEWMSRCENYFLLDCTPPELKVRLVSRHMVGDVFQWHHTFMKDRYNIFPSWPDYVVALYAQFNICPVAEEARITRPHEYHLPYTPYKPLRDPFSPSPTTTYTPKPLQYKPSSSYKPPDPIRQIFSSGAPEIEESHLETKAADILLVKEDLAYDEHVYVVDVQQQKVISVDFEDAFLLDVNVKVIVEKGLKSRFEAPSYVLNRAINFCIPTDGENVRTIVPLVFDRPAVVGIKNHLVDETNLDINGFLFLKPPPHPPDIEIGPYNTCCLESDSSSDPKMEVTVDSDEMIHKTPLPEPSFLLRESVSCLDPAIYSATDSDKDEMVFKIPLHDLSTLIYPKASLPEQLMSGLNLKVLSDNFFMTVLLEGRVNREFVEAVGVESSVVGNEILSHCISNACEKVSKIFSIISNKEFVKKIVLWPPDTFTYLFISGESLIEPGEGDMRCLEWSHLPLRQILAELIFCKGFQPQVLSFCVVAEGYVTPFIGICESPFDRPNSYLVLCLKIARKTGSANMSVTEMALFILLSSKLCVHDQIRTASYEEHTIANLLFALPRSELKGIICMYCTKIGPYVADWISKLIDNDTSILHFVDYGKILQVGLIIRLEIDVLFDSRKSLIIEASDHYNDQQCWIEFPGYFDVAARISIMAFRMRKLVKNIKSYEPGILHFENIPENELCFLIRGKRGLDLVDYGNKHIQFNIDKYLVASCEGKSIKLDNRSSWLLSDVLDNICLTSNNINDQLDNCKNASQACAMKDYASKDENDVSSCFTVMSNFGSFKMHCFGLQHHKTYSHIPIVLGLFIHISGQYYLGEHPSSIYVINLVAAMIFNILVECIMSYDPGGTDGKFVFNADTEKSELHIRSEIFMVMQYPYEGILMFIYYGYPKVEKMYGVTGALWDITEKSVYS